MCKLRKELPPVNLAAVTCDSCNQMTGKLVPDPSLFVAWGRVQPEVWKLPESTAPHRYRQVAISGSERCAALGHPTANLFLPYKGHRTWTVDIREHTNTKSLLLCVQTTCMAKKRRGDWLVKWLIMLGVMGLLLRGLRISWHSTSVLLTVYWTFSL